ncbi:MAG: NAD(+) synthase [Planctomycetia bacterium]|jgi:NAD+ synthase (glutamine-hydrolysing)
MRLIRVATVAINQTPMDWDGNLENILAAIEKARAGGASIVCMPELCTTGYGCEDAFFSSDVQQRAVDSLLEIIPHTTGMAVSVGLPLMHNGVLYNCVAMVVDQKLLGLVAKRNLAGDGIHYEPRWFKAWPEGKTADILIGETTYPIGDLIFDLDGVRIGFEICEDAWVAGRPARTLVEAAVDLILNPSASHFAFGKQETRRRLVQESSRSFGAGYIYANLLGNEAGRVIYDGGTLIAERGKLLAEGKRFAMTDRTVTFATLDINATRMERMRSVNVQPGNGPTPKIVPSVGFHFPEQKPTASTSAQPTWETGNRVKEEEFARAVALGLFDYLRKSYSHGFVVSLSGGADSATVAILVHLAIRFGVDQLGLDGFLKKLVYVLTLADVDHVDQITDRLLTTVYQSTRNSSQTTREAAAGIAKEIGARHLEFDVDPLVQAYIKLAAGGIGRELTWERDDLTLQNIQARARGPSVWMMANLDRALLLSTSNRSEAAVGYATMDGDTCGGLAPIAGIDKAFIRKWLVWIRDEGPSEVGPLPAADLIVRQQPTAELRPQESGQTDEDDLMPYELLDAVERAAIRDKLGPLDVFRQMQVQFPDYTFEQLRTWVERFFQLWARNQWKRERYAPSFHLDDENLDPKTWCRFPILSGGFKKELAELRALKE